MITTIQLDDSVKRELDRVRENKETYEQIIVALLRFADEQKRKQEELLIEGCKVMAEENLKILEEFKYADAEMNKYWEWDGDL